MAAITGGTLTTLSSILKDYYLPPVTEQLNNEVFLMQRLEARDQELYGNRAVVPLHTGRSGGIGARLEGDALPVIGNQTYNVAYYDLKYQYGRLGVTGPSVAKTKSEAGSFLQSLKSEIDSVRNDLKKDLQRQVYGDSTGAITACGVTTAAAVVVLSAVTVNAVNYNEALAKGQIYVGMVVDVGTAANPQSLSNNNTVSAVSLTTPSFTQTTAITTTAANFVYRSQPAGVVTILNQELTGLKTIVSTTAGVAVGGITPTGANIIWDNQRIAVTGALTLDKMMQAFNSVRQQGGETSLLLTTLGIQRAYYNLFTQTTKFADPMQLQGGYQALTFMQKPLVADIDATWGNIYLLEEKSLKVFSTGDWKFLDEDGDILKWRVGFDAWEAVLARYLNIGATRRNTQLVMSGVTVAGNSDIGV